MGLRNSKIEDFAVSLLEEDRDIVFMQRVQILRDKYHNSCRLYELFIRDYSSDDWIFQKLTLLLKKSINQFAF